MRTAHWSFSIQSPMFTENALDFGAKKETNYEFFCRMAKSPLNTIKETYFFSPEAVDVHTRFIRNASLFVGSILLIHQFGDSIDPPVFFG